MNIQKLKSRVGRAIDDLPPDMRGEAREVWQVFQKKGPRDGALALFRFLKKHKEQIL